MSFTELLHTTKLPRKTLSLRLKELCTLGILIKSGNLYKLNGIFQDSNVSQKPKIKAPKNFNDRRIAISLAFIALLLSFSVSGFVLAMYFAQRLPQEEPYHAPTILGNFTMALDVYDVKDLYAWEAVIVFNSTQLKVLDIIPGNFFPITSHSTPTEGKAIFLKATDVGEGILFLGSTLCGNVSGNDGSGRLAIVIFGYLTSEYELPKIVQTERGYRTRLLDSSRTTISLETLTLTFNVVES